MSWRGGEQVITACCAVVWTVRSGIIAPRKKPWLIDVYVGGRPGRLIQEIHFETGPLST